VGLSLICFFRDDKLQRWRCGLKGVSEKPQRLRSELGQDMKKITRLVTSCQQLWVEIQESTFALG